MTEAGPQEIRDRAIRLLASREHSRQELRLKLASKSQSGELLERVLDSLENDGLQSDTRFLEHYLNTRKRKGFGPLRIRQELAQKGIPPEMIRDWVDDRDPAWDVLMAEVAERKFGSALPADFRDAARRARFLEYRGFPPDRIRGFLRAEG